MITSALRALQWVLATVILFSLAWAMWPFLANPASVTDAYQSAGTLAPLVFIILVAVAPTPGAIVGASGGGYFGVWQGATLLYLGNVLAAALTFGIVRWLGRPAVERLLEPEKLQRVDSFIELNPVLLWIVYALPIFPLELVTSAIALSNKKFWRFMIIPILALPLDAIIVTTIGASIAERYRVFFEYASIAIVVLLGYGMLHLLYAWKREEIKKAGKMVQGRVDRHVVQPATKFARGTGTQVKRGVQGIGRASGSVARNVHEKVVKPVGRLARGKKP